MSVSLRGTSFAENMPVGAILQTVFSTNTTTGSKVFSSRSVYEEVPGTLRVSLTPKSRNSVYIVRAHLYWGGWNTGTDIAPLFRVYWGTSAGSYTRPLGPLYNEGQLPGDLSSPSGCNDGYYVYGFGDNNCSAFPGHILTAGTANDSTLNQKHFALMWACGYEAGSRTLYWNRGIGTGNAYNPIHNCTLSVSEILIRD